MFNKTYQRYTDRWGAYPTYNPNNLNATRRGKDLFGGFDPDSVNSMHNTQMFNEAYSKPGGALVPYSGASVPMELVGDAAFDQGLSKIMGGTKGAGTGTIPKFNNGIGGSGVSLKGFFKDKVSPNFGWSKSKGLKAFGKDLGGWTGAGTIVPGIMAGAEALGNIESLQDANKTTEDLINDIVTSSASNPLANSYLTADQRSLLGKVKRGELDPKEFSLGTVMPNGIGSLLDIGKGALTGIAGGIPGMIVGGIGGAVNSGLRDSISEASSNQAELEALLMALQDAEAQYQSMKRPNFTGLGIQQRYQNMYA